MNALFPYAFTTIYIFSPRITVGTNLNRYNIIHAVFGMEDNLYILLKGMF